MKWVWRTFAVFVIAVFAAALIFRVEDTDPIEMRAKYGAPPSQFVRLSDGLEVHLRDEGPRDAPVIVLLHGSNADLHTWELWVEELRRDHRVIRFDQIGHGLTGSARTGGYALEDFFADIDELADRLGLDSFVLAGNSMGGNIAAGYALARPERLRGLVLVDASGAPVENDGGGNLAFTLARLPGVRSLAMSVLPRSVIERSLAQSVSNKDVVTGAAIDRYWELGRYPGNRTATLERFDTPREPFTAKRMRTLMIPTLVMWGVEDALVPVAAADWYARTIPNSRKVVYEGIGHLPHEEAPSRSVRDLQDWLATLPGEGGQEPRSRQPVLPS